MKTAILICSFTSFLFSGFWISYDISSEVGISGYGSEDIDEGAITVGYNFNSDKKMNFGMSYDVKGGSFDSYGSPEYQILNIYSRFHFTDSEDKVQVWGSLGYAVPMGDLDDFGVQGGLSYGVGVRMDNGIGLSYTAFSGEYEEDDYYYYYDSVDVDYNKISISYNF